MLPEAPTVVPRGQTRTFYPRQVPTIKYLGQLAFREARNPPRFKRERYTFQCICNWCHTRDDNVKGAVEALEWLVSHNRHNTYVKAVKLNGVPLKSGEDAKASLAVERAEMQ